MKSKNFDHAMDACSNEYPFLNDFIHMLDYHGSLFFEQKFSEVFFDLFLKPCAPKHDVIGHMKSHNQVVIIEDLSILTKKVSQHLIHMLWFNSSKILLVFMDVDFG